MRNAAAEHRDSLLVGNQAIAEKLAALIPQMQEDAQIHRTWETPAAQSDMAKPSEKPLADWVGNAEWHTSWAEFYEQAATTMTEAVAALRSEGTPPLTIDLMNAVKNEVLVQRLWARLNADESTGRVWTQDDCREILAELVERSQ